MRRGAKPGKAKVEPKRPRARKSLRNEGSRVRQLQKRLEEALKREAEAFEQQTETAAHFGIRTFLAVPLVREAVPIGLITMQRTEIRPFSDKQIELLKTFADQAVIAIENVRLFTELRASNRELTTALDTQTATSDILRVISRSQTDVHPVINTIVASVVRLMGAYTGMLTRNAAGQIEMASLTSTDEVGDG